MNKKNIIQSALAQIEAILIDTKAAAESAKNAATHAESKPESKWDTFGLEASYLAGAQVARVSELENAIAYFKNLLTKKSQIKTKIYIEALVRLSNGETNKWYFLANYGAGIKVQSVTIISPASPIGKKLLEKEIGDLITLSPKKIDQEYEIVEILY